MSSWAQYTLVSENRDELMAKLKEANIPSVIYYGKCMHEQTAFEELNFRDNDFNISNYS